MKLAGGNGDDLAHAAVDMHPEHLEADAAIGALGPAGDAVSAVEVGLDRAEVAGAQAVGTLACFEYLDTEFVAEDTGVFEERLAAAVGVQIRSADSYAADPYKGLSFADSGGRLGLGDHQLARFLQDNRLHAGILPVSGRGDQPDSTGGPRSMALRMDPVGWRVVQ